jgi:hypothetical protein
VNKREFMQRAWLAGLMDDCQYKHESIAKMAGEEYDRLFPEEKPSESGWIRFSDRAPTEEDCIETGGDFPQLCVWLIKKIDGCGMPMHIGVKSIPFEAFGRTDCFWRPVPPRPEMKP